MILWSKLVVWGFTIKDWARRHREPARASLAVLSLLGVLFAQSAIAQNASTPNAASQKAIAQPKLVVGQTSRSASDWPNYVAEAKGFYKEAGLSAETIYVGNVSSVAQQVAAGSLDVGQTTMEASVRTMEAGAPVILVGSTLLKYPYSLMSVKTVRKPADLKGTTVILPVPKSDIENFFNTWLIDNGVQPSDVDRVYDGSSTNRYAALVAGVVSAATLNSPLDFSAASNGYFKILDFGKYVKDYGFIGILVRKSWAAQHSDTLRRYLTALSRAVAWLYDPKNRDEAIAILMRATKQDHAIAEKTYDYYLVSLHAFSDGLDLPSILILATL